MAVFSVNQFRQLYVAKNWKGVYDKSNVTNVGDMAYKVTQDGKLYFVTKTKGGLLRSDLIDLKKIYDARTTSATNDKYALKEVLIQLASGVTPVKGQDYGLDINFKSLISMGEEDTYDVSANVVATSNTASDLYKELAKALYFNLSHMEIKYVDIYLKTSSAEVKMDLLKAKEYTGNTLTGTYTGVVIRESDRSDMYVRGVYDIKPLNFTVIAFPTKDANGVETDWVKNDTGVVLTPTNSTMLIGNGMKIADLEYFCMGERGDIYRKVNWPFFIPTDYLVDPTLEYDTLNMHFYWSGEGVQTAHSDRDITIVAPHTDSNNIIDAIKTAMINAGIPVASKSGDAVVINQPSVTADAVTDSLKAEIVAAAKA